MMITASGLQGHQVGVKPAMTQRLQYISNHAAGTLLRKARIVITEPGQKK